MNDGLQKQISDYQTLSIPSPICKNKITLSLLKNEN
jgi:hypothetical protein